MKTIQTLCMILFGALSNLALAAEQSSSPGMMTESGTMNGQMMSDCMMMTGPMMWICILFGLLVLAVLVLAILALIKYLRSGKA